MRVCSIHQVGRWYEKASLNFARSEHALWCNTGSSTINVMGGSLAGESPNELEHFDVRIGRWTSSGNPSFARSKHCAVANENETQVFILGGKRSADAANNSSCLSNMLLNERNELIGHFDDPFQNDFYSFGATLLDL